jgi:hypothetical protein
MNIARDSPKRRAFFCWLSGSLPERMEMNTMLSIPNTISSTVKVKRLIRESTVKRLSIEINNYNFTKIK